MCRSHLSPWYDEKGNQKWYGRFNQGVVSLNLPQIGLVAKGDMNKFWKILDARLDLCFEALMFRHSLLKGTKSDTSPVLWQHGAYARLQPGETIDKLLVGGYSTISLGYVGIYEMVQAMLSVSHTTPEGKEFAMQVMKKLKDTTDRWKEETTIGFGLYGSPAESLQYRFARIDKARFGEVKNVTDRLYYTNSYHVHVTEKIGAFNKLAFEAPFHELSSGGCISYVEAPNLTNNLEAVKDLINFIYHNVQYCELNTRPDLCYICEFKGEIKTNENLVWTCPSCGNQDKSQMHVLRRTCGYLGSAFWNKGRTAEISERVLHFE